MEEEARHQLLASTFICTYVGVHQHAKHKNIQNKSKKRKPPYIAIFWCISFICLEGQSLKWCWSAPPSSQHLSHTRTSLYILQPRQQLTPAANIPVTARAILCSSIAQAACDMRTTPTPRKFFNPDSKGLLMPYAPACLPGYSSQFSLELLFLTGRVPKTQALAPFSIYTSPPMGHTTWSSWLL